MGGRRKSFDLGDEWLLDKPHVVPKSIRECQTVQVKDLSKTDLYKSGDDVVVRLVEKEGLLSRLSAPLIKDGKAIGAIMLGRAEAGGFSEAEVSLIQTFAAQAVIGIENVCQFREVQERFEREEASGEVLSFISTSREDEVPVFETILESASRLCRAPIAFLSLANEDRSQVAIPAHRGTRSEFGDILEGFTEPITRTELVAVRPIANGEVVLEDDIKDHDTYRDGDPRRRQMVDVEGARSVIAVPLLQSGAPIGAIVLYQREVAPFSQDDLSLVQSFAAQAVIAIENVRQFREVQERLERERASAEILDVISRSRDDDHPVFDVIVESVSRLCNAPLAYLSVLNEDRTHVTIPAQTGAGDEFAAALGRFSETVEKDWLFVVKSALNCETIRFDDLADSDLYKSGNEYRVKMVDEEGMPSVLVIPL